MFYSLLYVYSTLQVNGRMEPDADVGNMIAQILSAVGTEPACLKSLVCFAYCHFCR
jgi:hypothetical protein